MGDYKYTSKERARMPAGTEAILNARSLTTAHLHLASLLQSGFRVLDVGCGTGSITAGIAQAVAPEGHAIGIDINTSLIEEARRLHTEVPNLSFTISDIYSIPFLNAFDIVSAARILQWLSSPADALRMLVAATKPGGRVVVLDYNHEKIAWQPSPPDSVRTFYHAFLQWRAEVGMDNAIADRLSAMFDKAGLVNIGTTIQHETTQRGDADFDGAIELWGKVIAIRGRKMVADGTFTEKQRASAEADFVQWASATVVSQTLYLLAVEGTR